MVKRVSIIGLGYIGLPTAALVAEAGHVVIGVDINPDIVDQLNQAKVHIREPDLDVLLDKIQHRAEFHATTLVEKADVFIIAVPTPFKANHQPDLSHVQAACQSIAPHLVPGNLVILESTSPVGTTHQMVQWFSACRPDLIFPSDDLPDDTAPEIHVAYCPERVLPGKILHELVHNDRMIGGITPLCAKRAQTFYQSFIQGQCFVTGAKTAELVKLAENTYRDINIAFANELSLFCESLQMNVHEVIDFANRHPRVDILKPGLGVGGHCIAVDPWFLIDTSPENMTLAKQARTVNTRKTEWITESLQRCIDALGVEKPIVAYLGLAYKPEVDDLRNSPAVDILQALVERQSAAFCVVEPHISVLPASLSDHSNVTLVSLERALEEADLIAVMVPHRVFNVLKERRSEWGSIFDPVGLLEPALYTKM